MTQIPPTIAREIDGYDDTADVVDPEDSIEAGICPWCPEYRGDSVPQHASSAHPEKWADHTS